MKKKATNPKFGIRTGVVQTLRAHKLHDDAVSASERGEDSDDDGDEGKSHGLSGPDRTFPCVYCNYITVSA